MEKDGSSNYSTGHHRWCTGCLTGRGIQRSMQRGLRQQGAPVSPVYTGYIHRSYTPVVTCAPVIYTGYVFQRSCKSIGEGTHTPVIYTVIYTGRHLCTGHIHRLRVPEKLQVSWRRHIHWSHTPVTYNTGAPMVGSDKRNG
jgi:hypothetical protein